MAEFLCGMATGVADGLRCGIADGLNDGFLVGIAAGFVHLGEACPPSSIH